MIQKFNVGSKPDNLLIAIFYIVLTIIPKPIIIGLFGRNLEYGFSTNPGKNRLGYNYPWLAA